MDVEKEFTKIIHFLFDKFNNIVGKKKYLKLLT